MIFAGRAFAIRRTAGATNTPFLVVIPIKRESQCCRITFSFGEHTRTFRLALAFGLSGWFVGCTCIAEEEQISCLLRSLLHGGYLSHLLSAHCFGLMYPLCAYPYMMSTKIVWSSIIFSNHSQFTVQPGRSRGSFPLPFHPPSPVSRSAVVPPMRCQSAANARVIGGLGRHQAEPETRPEIAWTCPGKGGVMAWTSFRPCSEKIKIVLDG